MEGSNQYLCRACSQRQDAVRTIKLTKLPPTLNLQLLRFVYDRQNARRKKINSYIKFSETLEISQDFCRNTCDRPVTYSLCAVLVHHGQSAHSGHYIAHIKDRKSGTWYKFNDERVEQIEGKLKLSLDENGEDIVEVEAAGDTEKAPPKLVKGQHASKNAYMLVYKDASQGKLCAFD